MSKVILHNGRCGSTYLYLCMDRYYRAREGDNSLGDFMSIYERDYDLNKCKYVGLNEFLVPEVINSVYYNNTLMTSSPARTEARGKEERRGELHNVMYTTMVPDSYEKEIRRYIVKNTMQDHFVLLKYPLLTNPKTNFDADYISCERADVRAQTRSLYLAMTTGYYHIGPGEERKIQRLSKFEPGMEVLDRWTYDMEKSWEAYRAMKPKQCQTFFMEDFENLKPYQVLEMVGLNDWNKYLDKNFDVPIRKVWSTNYNMTI